MAERPILFSAPMVRAILEGRKTQTRRPIKPQPKVSPELESWVCSAWNCGEVDVPCPFGEPGDLLWVRETFIITNAGDAVYRADYPENAVTRGLENIPAESEVSWRPSTNMPKWAARIWLRVTDVRVERVQDITEEDAREEGVNRVPFYPADGFPLCDGYMAGRDDGKSTLYPTAREAFADAWRSIYGESWNRNDWVWVISFERCEPPAREGGR